MNHHLTVAWKFCPFSLQRKRPLSSASQPTLIRNYALKRHNSTHQCSLLTTFFQEWLYISNDSKLRALLLDRTKKIVLIPKRSGGKGIDKVFIKIYFEHNIKVGHENPAIPSQNSHLEDPSPAITEETKRKKMRLQNYRWCSCRSASKTTFVHQPLPSSQNAPTYP